MATGPGREIARLPLENVIGAQSASAAHSDLYDGWWLAQSVHRGQYVVTYISARRLRSMMCPGSSSATTLLVFLTRFSQPATTGPLRLATGPLRLAICRKDEAPPSASSRAAARARADKAGGGGVSITYRTGSKALACFCASRPIATRDFSVRGVAEKSAIRLSARCSTRVIRPNERATMPTI